MFSKNIVAFDAYRKKWQWGKGGKAVIQNTLFKNSLDFDIKGDKYSEVRFVDSHQKGLQIEGKLRVIKSFIEL